MHLQIYNQKPLVKTIANKYIQPIGMNAVVAIQIYAGYNQSYFIDARRTVWGCGDNQIGSSDCCLIPEGCLTLAGYRR